MKVTKSNRSPGTLSTMVKRLAHVATPEGQAAFEQRFKAVSEMDDNQSVASATNKQHPPVKKLVVSVPTATHPPLNGAHVPLNHRQPQPSAPAPHSTQKEEGHTDFFQHIAAEHADFRDYLDTEIARTFADIDVQPPVAKERPKTAKRKQHLSRQRLREGLKLATILERKSEP